ncbi:MAG: C25 family cysteine peptidase, partial [candidate division WOR-3 bacterium]|nr:C25 family cysteine peptidase [candidate division WOR-3 bacterium]
MHVILFTIFIINSLGSASVNLVSDNPNQTILEFNLPEFRIETTIINYKPYDKVVLPQAITYLEKGLPELPRFYTNIIIDDEGEYNYQILDAQYETLAVNPILPSKGNLTRDINPETVPYVFSSFYNENRYFPESNVNLSPAYILRDFRGLTIHYNPFQYNPRFRHLIVCKYLKLKLYKEKSGGTNIKIRPENKVTVTNEFKDLYQNFFVNFSPTRYDSVLERAGRMIIITADRFYENIRPFALWKMRKGVPVKIKRYSEIGSGPTAIKNYIQSEYNLGNLVWILIVGDSADVPPARTTGLTINAAADPVYTYLEGNDYFPDAFISRFSANSGVEVDIQVNKTIAYEQTLVTGGNWERKGTGIASDETGSTPYADSTRANWLRNMLLNYNYILVDKIYEPYGNATMITNAINEGRSIVNYIGHGSATSWSSVTYTNSNVSQLTNVHKLPFIFSVACLNGQFGPTTCFAEAWLRAGSTTNPTGAIAFYGSSISQAWIPPTVAQAAACTLLVQERFNTIGGLAFNGSCHMIAAYLPGTDGVKEFQTWHIFGDASVQLRTLPPASMTINYPQAVPIGISSINVAVSGVSNALVGIFKDSILYGSGYTDASGNIVINLSQPLNSVGFVYITVTAYNKATFMDSIAVVVPNMPYVIYQKSEILDPMPGGNGNGNINPGEAIEMRVWLKNFGSVVANNVRAWLRSTDPNI